MIHELVTHICHEGKCSGYIYLKIDSSKCNEVFQLSTTCACDCQYMPKGDKHFSTIVASVSLLPSRSIKSTRGVGAQGVPEVPFTVAYQGVPGAYSEVAALAACPGWRHTPCNNFESVFQVPPPPPPPPRPFLSRRTLPRGPGC